MHKLNRHEHQKERYINLNIDVNKRKRCTCDLATPVMRCFNVLPEQVYAYHETFSFTDVGVGSVKTLQRRKVKKVYLPEKSERGVGSEDVLSAANRKVRHTERTHCDQKTPAIKSVRDILNENKVLVHEKLSPIRLKTSTTTSPIEIRIEMGINTDEKELLAVTTQMSEPQKIDKKGKEEQKKKKGKIKEASKPVEKVLSKRVSSDSLVQHVHNLEIPSDDKQSKTSIDPMENKLEREYRKIFTTKSKDTKPKIENPTELKTASVFRRRFEALRRGLLKKEEAKKNDVLPKISSHRSVVTYKDVSIASDPPSLEGRSFSNTKIYSPFQMYTGPEKPIYKAGVKEESIEKQTKESFEWPPMTEQDSDYNGVKGMFRLWGKKFNLDEDKKRLSPVPSDNVEKDQPNKLKDSLNAVTKQKKERRKFLFFKKNARCKMKKFEAKKSVTAGRCEIKDGLVIKIGGSNLSPEKVKSDVSGDIVKKQWLLKYLSHDRASTNSVSVRWNNKMYRTSSSTIFELMDNVYKDFVLQSRSEIISRESSYYKPYSPRVKFAPQEFEAWMVAKTVTDRAKEVPLKIKNSSIINGKLVQVTSKNIHNSIQRLCQKIQVVLHSKNNAKVVDTDSSSEYIRIDIPKTFFESSSNDSEKEASRDEEVYNVVEYDAVSETTVVKNTNKNMETGEYEYNDIQIIVSVKDSKDLESKIVETVIKRPATQRDVIIQGSNVNVPKKCDVIGVGIITQRDMREMRNKPILKVREDLSDDDSEQNFQNNSKKCELAESYLQQYYRHWSPLAIDLFSWRTSDTNVRCSSETSRGSIQGDGTKSCPNVYDDFQTSAAISSDNSCDPCPPCNHTPIESEAPKHESSFTEKLLKKLKLPKADTQDKRHLPKDSFEVYKKRKLYAMSNKSKWTYSNYGNAPCSVPSSEDKNTMAECPNKKKTSFQQPEVQAKTNPCHKHVSLPDCEKMNALLAKQMEEKKIESILSFKGAAKCDVCKRDAKCPKHAKIKSDACAITEPACKPKCEKDPKPPCSKESSKTNKTSPPKGKTKTKQKPACEKAQRCDTPPPSPPCRRKCLKPSPKKPPPCGSPPPCRSPPPCGNPPPCGSPPPCETPPPCEAPHRHEDYTHNNPCSPPSPRHKSPNKNTQKGGHHIVAPCGKPCCSSSSCRARSRSPKQRSVTPPCCKKPSSLKLMPMCIHYPPCRKSQSIQISPQKCSAKNSPINSPPCSPKNKKKTTPCSVPPCSLKKKEEKKPPPPPPPPPRCDTPPCRKPSPPKPVCPDDYPWPMKNQISNSPSLNSICEPKKSKNKCMKSCPLSPKPVECAKKVKNKECKPDCPSRENLPPCPSPPICPPIPKASKNAFNHSKMSGIHLKMKPSNKTCSEECLAWKDEEQQGVIRLNSRERINIRMKQETPSTEEIRECVGVKVKDDDGDTLYERRDYRKNCLKQSLLGDMYQTSNINRLSTPTSLKNLEETDKKNKNMKDKKSDSVANLVEITFKLRVTQGDKTTEINIANENDKKERAAQNDICQTPQEVYVVKKHSGNDSNPPNDVKVRIVIKNYKPKTNSEDNGKYQREFSKKISEKFHTVSTAYSGMSLDRNPENVYSVHRTTIDLTSSYEKSKTSDLTNVESIDVTDTENAATKNSKDTNKIEKVDSTNVSRCNSSSYCVQNETTRTESLENQSISESSTNSCVVMRKPRNRREQKEMLKEVLKKANETELSDKIKIKQLKRMLQVILSDSQQHKNDVSNKDLVNDVTLAFLPNYLKGSASDNNVNNSVFDSINDKASCDMDAVCMCSKLAEKLKLCKAGDGNCCCCGLKASNKETSCTMSDDSNVLFFNYMTEEVNIDTCNLKHVSRKIESTSFSYNSNRSVEGKNDENYVTEITNSTSLCNKDRVSNETIKNTGKEIDEKNDIRSKVIKTAKVLQSYEMKRAVLQMYAGESLIDSQDLIASLPRFSVEKEDEIHRYEQLLDRRNFIRSYEQ